MPHKVVAPETIQRLKETIAYFDKVIQEAKSYSSGDKDAIKGAMEVVREWEFDANYKKDLNLKDGTDTGANNARRWQGKQEAYQDLLTLFEAPQSVIDRYVAERRQVQNQLDQYAQLESRDTIES